MTHSLPTLREAGPPTPSAVRPRFAPIRNEGNLLNPGADFLSAIGLNVSPLGSRVTEITALGVSTVFACVHYIASIVSTLPLELYRTLPNNSREAAVGHPVRRLMKSRPNPIMVSSDVRYALAYNQALHGNAYAQLVYARSGRAAEIYPLRTRNVTMTTRPGNIFPEFYVTSDLGGRPMDFKHILHLRGMSCDGIKGIGPQFLAANLIGLAQALEENASRFFANGSRPGMIYTTAPGVNLTEPQRDAMKTQLKAAYEGVENFYKTMVLEGGGKIELARANNDASQFEQITRRTHQQICQFFGVPPHKVGILDNATFSNIEQQQIQAVQDLFLPWCKRWEEAFGGALLTPEEQDIYYFKHKLDGLLRGDIVTRTQAQSTWLQNGVLSINEVREMEDRDPIKGGDAHVRQLNMADINAPTAPPKPAQNAA
ncbi:MAG: phage portal protein [Verrucomicrobiota bacterium]